MKMIKLLLTGLVFVNIIACSYSNGNPQTPNTTQSQIDPHDSVWQPKTDDIQVEVSPAWHNGKDYKIEQNLHSNPVKKEKINVQPIDSENN